MGRPNAEEVQRRGLLLLLLRLAVLIMLLLLLLLLLRRTTAWVPGPGDLPALHQSRPRGKRHEGLLLCCTCHHTRMSAQIVLAVWVHVQCPAADRDQTRRSVLSGESSHCAAGGSERTRRCNGRKVWMHCRKEASWGAGPCTRLRKSLILTRPCHAQSSQAKGKLSASLSCLLKKRDSLIVSQKLRLSGCMRWWGCSCWYTAARAQVLSTYLRKRGGAWSREASNVEKSRSLTSCQMCW